MTLPSRSGPGAEINVTPLIDVLLVLLIIFMVIMPHRNLGETADIPQPPQNTKTPPPVETIVIQLHDLGEGRQPALKINQREVSWENLGPRLQSIFAGRAEKVAFLKGDPELDFQYVAKVVDITHRAGVGRIGLLGSKQ
jgi:biopolymer transport protein TolR